MVPKIVGDNELKIVLFRYFNPEEETGNAEEQPVSNKDCQVK